MALSASTAGSPRPTNDRLRRTSPIVVRPGEGLLSDHIAGAQRGRRELLFMPRSRHSRSAQEWPSEVVGSLSDHGGGSSRCTYRVVPKSGHREPPKTRDFAVPQSANKFLRARSRTRDQEWKHGRQG